MTSLDDAYRALAVESVSPKVEALIEAMFLAAVADGSISPEESSKFAATVSSISKGKIARESIDRRVGELTVLLGSEGRKARFESLKKRLDDLYESGTPPWQLWKQPRAVPDVMGDPLLITDSVVPAAPLVISA